MNKIFKLNNELKTNLELIVFYIRPQRTMNEFKANFYLLNKKFYSLT